MVGLTWSIFLGQGLCFCWKKNKILCGQTNSTKKNGENIFLGELIKPFFLVQAEKLEINQEKKNILHLNEVTPFELAHWVDASRSCLTQLQISWHNFDLVHCQVRQQRGYHVFDLYQQARFAFISAPNYFHVFAHFEELFQFIRHELNDILR